MKTIIHLGMKWSLIIGATCLASWNVSVLLPTNPDYEASWGKVAFCILLIITGANLPNEEES